MEYTYADDIEIDVLDVSKISKEALRDFCCDNPSLDAFLHEDALNASAKTFLFVDVATNIIVAYTSIACSAIMYAVEDDDEIMLSPERFSLSSAIEIMFFAVDKRYRHLRYSDTPAASRETLSSNLFRYTVNHIFDIARETIGADYIILYAVPKAENFYKRNGFRRFDGDMMPDANPFLDGCIPMYRDI